MCEQNTTIDLNAEMQCVRVDKMVDSLFEMSPLKMTE